MTGEKKQDERQKKKEILSLATYLMQHYNEI